MANHFKVHELLTSDQLAELEKFAREPGQTIDACHEWLQAAGFTLSRSAVGTWKQAFDQTVLAERMQGAGGLAKAFMDAAKDGGGLQIADAAMLQIAQMLFEACARASANGDVPIEMINQASLAMQRLMLAKAREEKTRTEMQNRELEAVDAASKVVEGGGTAKDAIATIKAKLGITQQQ